MRWWHLKQIITLNYYIGDLTDYLFTGWLCQVWTSPGNPNLCLHRSGHQRHSESVWQRFLCDSERLFHCEVERPSDYCERCQEPLCVCRSEAQPAPAIPSQPQPANRNVLFSEDPVLTALNLAILKDLWMPDVEIRNLQSFETHTILSKLEGLWVDEDHNLMHALASRITFICPMRFNSFPMDVQVSPVRFHSLREEIILN